MKVFGFFRRKKIGAVHEPPLPKNKLPHIRTKTVPGPKSQKLTELLKRYECPQITTINENMPVFFKRAEGTNVIDVDGNRYMDLTSAFAVSSIGHTNRSVLKAIRNQSRLMMHGMGDVHPNEVKVALAKRLADLTPGNLSMSIFSSTGFEAVESALKTVVMHTKKTGVIAFTGAYHGLGYGALHVTHREDFRKPFLKQLSKFAVHVPFPDPRLYDSKASEVSFKAIKKCVKKQRRSPHAVGAILVEPIQGRGGIVSPPPNFLKELRAFCDAERILLIADEVFTGFGRTGFMFAMQKSEVVPDILCLGKGMGGGFPISACIGSPRVMISWGQSTGDAIHTSTFLGNPLGCAVALAVIEEIERKKFVERSKNMGEIFRRELHKLKLQHSIITDIRGSGLMIGMEFGVGTGFKPAPTRMPKIIPATDKARRFIVEALKKGIILLPSGENHNVISITPPFVITEKEIHHAVKIFDEILKKL